MEVDTIISQLRELYGDKPFRTRDDVSFVLKQIAPAGEERELKKQVIEALFPGKSSQGYSTAQDLDSYPEY